MRGKERDSDNALGDRLHHVQNFHPNTRAKPWAACPWMAMSVTVLIIGFVVSFVVALGGVAWFFVNGSASGGLRVCVYSYCCDCGSGVGDAG